MGIPVASDIPEELLGKRLNGNDFTYEQIEQWFVQEQSGYSDLVSGIYADTAGVSYGYAALNYRHGFRHLQGREFDTCLALGCAQGDDVVGIAPRVKRFIAIEPAKNWWSPSIGGTPADYREPDVLGRIAVEDGSIDLAVSFGVLHHIPNVEFVISEIGRCLAKGGVFMLREPVVSMGDFRKPRRGLTANERGIPVALLENYLMAAGMVIERRNFYLMSGIEGMARKLGIRQGMSSPIVVWLDAIASALTRWNARYWRPKLWQKIAPTSVFIMAVKSR